MHERETGRNREEREREGGGECHMCEHANQGQKLLKLLKLALEKVVKNYMWVLNLGSSPWQESKCS